MRAPLCLAAVVALLALAGCSSTGQRSEQVQQTPIKEVVKDQRAADFSLVASATRQLVERHGAQHVLVVYDIDNTVLAMSTALGSDQWFDWQLGGAGAQRIHNGTSTDIGCLLEAQDLLYFLRPMRLTDPTQVQQTFAEVRALGATQWALTSRGSEYAAHTARELARFDLDFSPFTRGDGRIEADATYPAFDEASKARVFTPAEIGNKDFRLDRAPAPVRLQDGVYYTTGQHKGTMLRLLLDRLQLTDQIKGVVFIDDKGKNVLNVEMALQNGPIDYVLVRYSHEDAAVGAFEQAAARDAATRDWCGVISEVPALLRSVDPAVLDLSVGAGADAGKDLVGCLVDVCGG